jgi:hypothetical protein
MSARFLPIFDFELMGKRSRAEPSRKSFSSSSGSSQLELWLEPARLGLITSIYAVYHKIARSSDFTIQGYA